MKHRFIALLTMAACLFPLFGEAAARKFVHPGITYTQGDLDRMKAMVEAKVEPFYSTFLALKNSQYSDPNQTVTQRGTQIPEGRFNATVGIDGRRAIDLALLWHITGDRAYADKAVEFLNANSYYTNTSSRGTGPLDNGKVYLLIDAAELMRDYDGWAAEDQQRFKNMLTYPYYSTTEDLYAKYASSDETKNGITFYWNCYNGDCARFGNQGLFAMRAIMSMGIYLDNDTIYDRAYRYLMAMPHRPDDLAYPAGPPSVSSRPSSVGEYQDDYTLYGRDNTIEDYGYDELLKYYIYENGQCEESSRDQGHVMGGLHNYCQLAEMAWCQGDSLWTALDNRILKGLEWSYRYNLSFVKSYDDCPEPWEPTGFTTDEKEATFENGLYYQTQVRAGRWALKNVSPAQRGDKAGYGGCREMALAQYAVRQALDPEKYTWLERYRDYAIEKYGHEGWGESPNWYYEWTGWGTLSKRRTAWMAGDPVSFATGERVSGIHVIPAAIAAVDYDFYSYDNDGEGHTYHNVGTQRSSIYRTDGTVEIEQADGTYVVTGIEAGEWMNYTVKVPVRGVYDVYVEYVAEAASTLTVAYDAATEVQGSLPASATFAKAKIGSLPIEQAGAGVVRLICDAPAAGLKIKNIVIELSEGAKSVELTGSLDETTYTLNWSFYGVLPQNVSVVRGYTDDPASATVLAENLSLSYYVDSDTDGKQPKTNYWLRYEDNGTVCYSDPVCFEWGYFDDRFEDETETWMWNTEGMNYGQTAWGGNSLLVSYDSEKAYLKRVKTTVLHGQFPILAFRMKVPQNTDIMLCSGTYKWNGTSNNYSRLEGLDDIYYYNLLDGNFRTSVNGSPRYTVNNDEIVTLSALQLRYTVADASADPVRFYWARTFRTLDELGEYTASVGSVESVPFKVGVDGRTLYFYELPEAAEITVYAIDGKPVVAGVRNMSSCELPAGGVYIVSLRCDRRCEVRKVVVG